MSPVAPSTTIGSVVVHLSSPSPAICAATQSSGDESPIGFEAMRRNRWSVRTGSWSTSRWGSTKPEGSVPSVEGSVAARAVHPWGYDTEMPCTVEVKVSVSGAADAAGEGDGSGVAVASGVSDGDAEGT